MMRFMLLFSRQGKLRLQKWYIAMSEREKKKLGRELMQIVLGRKPKMCSFLEWKDLKVVYKRYASLYFCCAIEDQDNELLTLELIHRYVELLDKYFGSVCELDIIFNFEKAYFILDEFIMGGEIQDTSKKNVLKAIEQADLMQEHLQFIPTHFPLPWSGIYQNEDGPRPETSPVPSQPRRDAARPAELLQHFVPCLEFLVLVPQHLQADQKGTAAPLLP
ncbi:AP-1 complex subunit sigma-1A isoform X1 [Leucoraja erinacea]|uniref:AP-1 complex subunit sigma-1A isoform X1 n=1 Tax=Leucoraja erinaceus TaxID=7782 RepID=UPI002458AFB9|nr:AP-1 complex subunit sigma-1A isoform X1 [Leucoraja erinacea]